MVIARENGRGGGYIKHTIMPDTARADAYFLAFLRVRYTVGPAVLLADGIICLTAADLGPVLGHAVQDVGITRGDCGFEDLGEVASGSFRLWFFCLLLLLTLLAGGAYGAGL